MRRRDALALIGGAAAAATLPQFARAQQAMPVVGFLHSGAAANFGHLLAAFKLGLTDAGYVEGRNVAIEPRWGDSRSERLAELAADLVRRQVSVIFVAGGPPSVLAVKAATTRIPVVFVASDPMRFGVVKSLSRPDGNLTGIGMFSASLGAKRFELLRQIVPSAAVIAFLVDPGYVTVNEEVKDMEEAARASNVRLAVLRAGNEGELDAAFKAMERLQAGALVVGAGTSFTNSRKIVIALAARHKMPAIYFQREFTADGGLMSYGNNLAKHYRMAGTYIDRILKGAQPADLPVMQPTLFELVINLKTAKALGITVPLPMHAAADEVIE